MVHLDLPQFVLDCQWVCRHPYRRMLDVDDWWYTGDCWGNRQKRHAGIPRHRAGFACSTRLASFPLCGMTEVVQRNAAGSLRVSLNSLVSIPHEWGTQGVEGEHERSTGRFRQPTSRFCGHDQAWPSERASLDSRLRGNDRRRCPPVACRRGGFQTRFSTGSSGRAEGRSPSAFFSIPHEWGTQGVDPSS